jgi:Tfp pilus assembly protein PilN
MSNQTFLPEDYVALKAERRTNIICLILFLVVMAAVFGAFLVTNQQWSQIKERQEAINVRYQQAAMDIAKVEELEAQKEEMLEKAELAGALVERVPRSILLAELINRMPPRLGLVELTFKSEKIKTVSRKKKSKNETGSIRQRGPQRGTTKEEAREKIKKADVPKFQVIMTMVGVAPSNREVAKYLSELTGYELVSEANLEYSEEKEMQQRLVRQFKITMRLDSDADVRDIEPLTVPREIQDPMQDTVRFGSIMNGE